MSYVKPLCPSLRAATIPPSHNNYPAYSSYGLLTLIPLVTALLVDDGGPRLIVLFPRYPHILKCGQRCEN